MNDSDSQIVNPLSGSRVSGSDHEVLIRQGVESDCEMECSQNPMLTEEENQDKSVVINKLLQKNSSLSNSKFKQSSIKSYLTSQQLDSQQYKINIKYVDSKQKSYDIGNPLCSGDEDGRYKYKDLEQDINQLNEEVTKLKDDINTMNKDMSSIKSENYQLRLENEQFKLKISNQQIEIKNIQDILKKLIKVEENIQSPPEKTCQKRSKTTIEFYQPNRQNQHNTTNQSVTTEKTASPLPNQSSFVINSSKPPSSQQKPFVPPLPLFNAQQLAQLLKLPLQKKDKPNGNSPKKEGSILHKQTKSSTIHLNQVKGQGLPCSLGLITTLLLK